MARLFYKTLPILFLVVLIRPLVANAATWTGLGGSITGKISVIRNSDGTLQAFARGTDHGLWTIAQTSPDGPWGAWQSIGGVLSSDPAAGMNGNGLVEVFALGSDTAQPTEARTTRPLPRNGAGT